MGRAFTIISTAVVTAVLTSALWIFYFNITRAPSEPNGQVTGAGDVATVDPRPARCIARVSSQARRARVPVAG